MKPKKTVSSFRSKFHKLSKTQQAELIRSLTPAEALALKYESDFWLRPNQIVSGDDWRYCLILAGRGFGKTKAGACWIKKCVESGSKNVAICGPTHKDVSQVMVPAIVAEYPASEAPEYNETRGKLVFANGAIAYCYSAETETRGPNIEKAWCDEIAKWSNADDVFDTLNMAVRVGSPQLLITTTPRKDIKTLRRLISEYEVYQADPLANQGNVKIIRGKTLDNRDHLSSSFISDLESRYNGTRLYRQEVLGELLDDAEDALWSNANIHENRISPDTIKRLRSLPKDQYAQELSLSRIVVSVDPAGSTNPDSDETGIIVAGLGTNGHGYLLEDASGRYSPAQWAAKTARLYDEYNANCVIAEKNFGGQMVEATIKTANPNLPVKLVHASLGKTIRAEPISAKYAQNLVHHAGVFPKLEDQLTNFTGAASNSRHKDDRLDSLVWAFTHLLTNKVTVRRDFTNLPNF